MRLREGAKKDCYICGWGHSPKSLLFLSNQTSFKSRQWLLRNIHDPGPQQVSPSSCYVHALADHTPWKSRQRRKVKKTGWLLVPVLSSPSFFVIQSKVDSTGRMCWIKMWNKDSYFFVNIFIYFNWKIIALRCCVSFSCTMNEVYVYIYSLPPEPPSHICIPPLWVVTEHQAELPAWYSKFPLAIYLFYMW